MTYLPVKIGYFAALWNFIGASKINFKTFQLTQFNTIQNSHAIQNVNKQCNRFGEASSLLNLCDFWLLPDANLGYSAV